jgi:WD40 repeat protein
MTDCGVPTGVRVWDPARDQDVARLDLPQHNEILRGPDTPLLGAGGRAVAAVHRKFTDRDEPNCLSVWDLTTRRVLRTFPLKEQTRCLAVSADGRTAVAGGGEEVLVCDLEAGRVVGRLGGHQDCNGVAISPDGRLTAGAVILPGEPDFDGHTLRLWELTSGREVCTLRGHTRGIGALTFSPDGRLLATAVGRWGYSKPISSPPEVRVWDTFRGREVACFRGAGTDASSLSFSPDLRRLISGHEDGTLLVWDLGTLGGPGTGRADTGNEALRHLWADLGAEDTPRARRAVGALVAAGEQAVPLLREHLRPAAVPDTTWVRRQVADLDSGDFGVRKRAFEDLAELGELAKEPLRKVLPAVGSLEVRKQVERLLEEADGWAWNPVGDRLRALRGVEILERIGTGEARQVLRGLAAGAPEARLTREAKAALEPHDD